MFADGSAPGRIRSPECDQNLPPTSLALFSCFSTCNIFFRFFVIQKNALGSLIPPLSSTNDVRKANVKPKRLLLPLSNLRMCTNLNPPSPQFQVTDRYTVFMTFLIRYVHLFLFLLPCLRQLLKCILLVFFFELFPSLLQFSRFSV